MIEETLVLRLERLATERGSARLFTFLEDGEAAERHLTYAELSRAARSIAVRILQHARPGDRVVLLLPPGLEYVASFVACLYAKVVAVPAYPPDPARLARTLPRLRAIVGNSRARVVVTSAAHTAITKHLAALAPELAALEWIGLDEHESDRSADWKAPSITSDDLAFIQYTSGSTSSPRGVLLSHGNLLANFRVIHQALDLKRDARGVSWLPPYHDMGLIGHILAPLYEPTVDPSPVLARQILLSPLHFLERPLRWLEAISKYRGAISFAPNFAYDLCCRKITVADREGLDLSSWRVAGNASEFIRASTLERFATAFASCGFRAESFFPCYGLAESTLLATAPARGTNVRLAHARAESLERGVFEEAAENERASCLVGCGAPLPDHRVAIVEPQTGALAAEGTIGEIWLSGPSVGQGYWDDADLSESEFRATIPSIPGARFLRTGDLGFLEDGQLFVTGRSKEVVVIRGRNVHPQDVEETVERAHPVIRPGRVAAFPLSSRGITEDAHEDDTLAVVVEVEPIHAPIEAEIAGAIRRVVAETFGLSIPRLWFTPPRNLPKTSSGKLQRLACAAMLRAGELPWAFPGTKPDAESELEGGEVESQLAAWIAELASIEAQRISSRHKLSTIGLDSIMVVDLRGRITAKYGVDVALEWFLDTSIEALARFIRGDAAKSESSSAPAGGSRAYAPKLRFSLFYFSSDVDRTESGRYRLLLESARFADQHAFEAVWIPERHFHPFGGIFPNPSVVGAAVAMATQRVRIRAGSVVLPLHSPIRVAEEWAVVDNLSGGRVDLAFATGWNANDFVLQPENFADRKSDFEASIQAVRRLWRGERVPFRNGDGSEVAIRALPPPLQAELPFWVTAAANVDTFELAGRMGANVLTALLLHSVDELEAKIQAYRRARVEAGLDPSSGRVTVMAHTFLADTVDIARETVRAPFTEYLRSSVSLWQEEEARLAALGEDERERVLGFSFERYFRNSALFGSPESCRELVARLEEIGVDEVACLIDFGIPFATTMEGLHRLARLAAGSESLVAPLSPTQEWIWIASKLRGPSHYNEMVALRLRGPLDEEALGRALERMIAEHDILRTSFVERDGRVEAEVASVVVFTCSVLDWRDHRADLGAFLEAERTHPFAFERGPLLRAHLVRLADEERVLVLTYHHLVLDGWSAALLLERLSAAYESIRTGSREVPLLRTPSHAIHTRSQSALMQEAGVSDQLAYWKAALAGLPRLDLPLDAPRPRKFTGRGGHVELAFDAEATARLKELARRSGVTLYEALLAAFAVLLHRLTDQADIPIATPVAGRSRTEVRDLLGCLFNVIIVRADLRDDPSFSDLLARLHRTVRTGLASSDVPLHWVARAVESARSPADPSRNVLADVMFDFLNVTSSGFDVPGVRCERVEVPTTAARYDLLLFLDGTGDRLEGRIEYNVDLFERQSVARMSERLKTLVASVTDDPRQPISRASWLPAEEANLLRSWNRTTRPYELERCLHTRVEAQVARTPTAVALVFGNESVTYAELDRRANQVANRLLRTGMRSEGLVAVRMERSIEMVVALLGILKAGGAYVPLDPSAPPSRTAFVLNEVKPFALLTQSALSDLAFESTDKPACEVSPDQLAYVIYTSGSTGTPKGAMNAHRAVSNRLLWCQDEWPLSASDRVLQKTPYTFDVSVWELFWPLVTGATLVIAKPGDHRDPPTIAELIREADITTIHFVPSMLRLFLEAPGLPHCTSLRRIFSSGEALTADLVRKCHARLPRVEVLNLYGPTEAAIDVTSWRCEPGSSGERIPIGRPIANVQIHILDAHDQPCPIGVPGELSIGGVAVGRGYLHRPDLTAKSFVPDPFSGRPGALLYKTGDRARFGEDGAIEYLGRLDGQVKLRGVRIETNEIVSTLRRHPNIRDATVVRYGDNDEEAGLAAYVVFVAEPLSSSELRGLLRQWLPDAMIPSIFVPVDALPLLPSGKVDRAALPRPPQAEAHGSKAVPRDSVELELARMWQETLGVADIGMSDSFFELGGHSLVAASLLFRMNKRFACDMPLSALFESPTIEQVASIIRGRTRPSWSPLVPIQPQGTRVPVFLVHPAGGNVLCYYDLARCLGREQPLYGLGAPGFYGLAPYSSVEEMARGYVSLIRERQPHGPYRLGGWSFGGVVAFEMARQLEEASEVVDLLLLLDTPHPKWQAERSPNHEDDATLLRAILHAQGFALESASASGGQQPQQAKDALQILRDAKVVPPDLTPAEAARFLQEYRDNLALLARYAPRPYQPKRCVVVRAQESGFDSEAWTGWSELFPSGVESIYAPGNHHTLLRMPNVALLATSLRKMLDQNQGL